MDRPDQPTITPGPTAEEAAAIITAIAAYLAEQHTPQLTQVPPARPWAIAGRLASQGQTIARLRGIRATWANVARISRE